jgi:hypothetical protein
MKTYLFGALLITQLAVAQQMVCPDLSGSHANVLPQGWAIASVSTQVDVMGSKRFSSVRIGVRKVLGSSWVMCGYDNEALVLIQYGKFNRAPMSSLWYRTYYYEQCDVDREACYFMRYR